MTTTQIGGKVIASGGFGCIFKPALTCSNDSNSEINRTNRITKLMTIKNATDEYTQIDSFKSTVCDYFGISNPQEFFFYDENCEKTN